MGWQVIRQPDGLLAIFSTVTDTWIVYDATPDDIVGEYVNRARRDARRDARRIIAEVTESPAGTARHPMARTFAEANRESRDHRGVYQDRQGTWTEPPEATLGAGL